MRDKIDNYKKLIRNLRLREEAMAKKKKCDCILGCEIDTGGLIDRIIWIRKSDSKKRKKNIGVRFKHCPKCGRKL